MSGVSYTFLAEVNNGRGDNIIMAEDPSIRAVLRKPVGVFANIAEEVAVRVIRKKADGSVDSAPIDIMSGKVEGRFSKHNTNVPVTVQREVSQAWLDLMA